MGYVLRDGVGVGEEVERNIERYRRWKRKKGREEKKKNE